MTQRRAKVIRPTKLEVRPDLLEDFAALGVPANAWPPVVAREQAKGTTQAEFDAGLEDELAAGREAKEANVKAAAEQAAEQAAAERKANRAAFAGMALQGILPGARAEDGIAYLARLAVDYADALCDQLDKPAETEE